MIAGEESRISVSRVWLHALEGFSPPGTASGSGGYLRASVLLSRYSVAANRKPNPWAHTERGEREARTSPPLIDPSATPELAATPPPPGAFLTPPETSLPTLPQSIGA